MTTSTRNTLSIFVLQALPGFEKENPGVNPGDLLTNPGPFFDEKSARQKTYEGSGTRLLRFDIDLSTQALVKVAPWGEKPPKAAEGEEQAKYTGPKSQTFIVDGKPVVPVAKAPPKVRKPGLVVSLPLDLEGSTSDVSDEETSGDEAEGSESL